MTTSGFSSIDVSPEHAKSERRVFEGFYGLLIVATLALFGMDYAFPGEFKWIFVSSLSGLSLIWITVRVFMEEKLTLDALDYAVLGFLAYATLSLLWSPDPLNGWAFVVKTALFVPLFFGIRHFGSESLVRTIVWSVVAGNIISLGFVALDVGLFGGYFNHNFLTEFLLLSLPFVLGLGLIHQHLVLRLLAGALGLTTIAYLLIYNPSKIEFIVIPGTLLLLAAALFWEKRKKLVIISALAMVLGVSAVVAVGWNTGIGSMGHGFKSSIYSRLGLNMGAYSMWKESPVFGKGAGSYNALYPYHQEKYLDLSTEREAAIFTSKETIAGAAHNEFLQLLACLGVVGALILAYFAFHLLRGFRRSLQPKVAYIGLATLTACLLNSLVEFPLQNPATALLTAFGIAFIAWQQPMTTGKRTFTVEHGLGLLLLLFVLGLTSLLAYGVWRFDSAQRHYRNTLAYLNVNPQQAFIDNMEAVRLYPWDTEMRVQSYVTSTRWFELTKVSPLTPADNDWLFNRAVKAGPTNMLLLARLQYLFNTGRINERKQEADQWLKHLTTNATLTPDVWILDIYFAFAAKDLARVARDIDIAEKLPVNDYQKSVLAKLKSELATQLTKQPATQSTTPLSANPSK